MNRPRRTVGFPTPHCARSGAVPFGAYVHVPFCATRCGYCDFNTYTPASCRAPRSGSTSVRCWPRSTSPDTSSRTHLRCRRSSSEAGRRRCWPPADQALMLKALTEAFGLAVDAEVTTEANPESVTAPNSWRRCAQPGSTASHSACRARCRMCWPPSTAPTLRDGWSTPSTQARAAGFDSVSVDLIYGTPGETLDDWRTSLEAAIALEPEHVSAYALIVEEGTALARRIDRGELPARRRRRPGGQVRTGRRAAGRGGLRLVRGVELGSEHRSIGAGTTSRTGRATTGGGSVLAPTATSGECGGGTSSIRVPTTSGWRPATARPWRARCSMTRRATWSGSSSRCGLHDGLATDVLSRRPGDRLRGSRSARV